MASQIPVQQQQQGAKKRPRDGEAENDDKGKRQKVDSGDSSGDSDSTDSTGNKMEVPQQQVPLDAIDGRRTEINTSTMASQQGAKKRPRDGEAENDDKGKRQKVDSEDSSGDSDSTDSTEDKIEVPQEQVLLDAIDGRRTEADHTESCTIQAVLRRGQNARQRTGGSYMQMSRLVKSGIKAELDFKGTDPYDSSTAFHLEKNDDEEDVNVLRFTDKETGDNYYMRVYSKGRVKLRKLENYPTNDKYLFYIKSISCMIGCPVTFKSKETGEYLSCDEEGEASMLEMTTTGGKGEPKDRRSWFCCHKIDKNPVEF